MTETKTDPATLPQYGGHPVPWVTRWTNEIAPDRFQYNLTITRDANGKPSKPELHYDDRNEDLMDGVLWQREGLSRGGKPDWASVSTYRQRLSMRKRKCQVCSEPITDMPIRWLMPLDGVEYVDEDTAITQQPPTCSACIELALELCPNLNRNGYMILRVLDYSIWGVYGQVIITHENKPTMIQTAICYDTEQYGPNFTLGQVMAQQQVVKLGKFAVEKIVDPTPVAPALEES
jgi:hypothetical protein